MGFVAFRGKETLLAVRAFWRPATVQSEMDEREGLTDLTEWERVYGDVAVAERREERECWLVVDRAEDWAAVAGKLRGVLRIVVVAVAGVWLGVGMPAAVVAAAVVVMMVAGADVVGVGGSSSASESSMANSGLLGLLWLLLSMNAAFLLLA